MTDCQCPNGVVLIQGEGIYFREDEVIVERAFLGKADLGFQCIRLDSKQFY